MKQDQQNFLSLLGEPPARLTAEQVAWFLNCQPHDMPALISARLLKPLGNPAPNSIKFFSRDELLELAKDRAWLSKMTAAINQHWQKLNARKSGPSSTPITEAAHRKQHQRKFIPLVFEAPDDKSQTQGVG